MQFPKFDFDRISFFLGFLAGTLGWWLISRFRPYITIYWVRLQKYLSDLNEQNQAGAEHSMRREMIRRCQRNHLAAPLFSLDEVLIEPRLISPPPMPTPGGPPHENAIALQTLPYVPDWPELISSLGMPTMTLAEAMKNGSHIAVIGQPGSGKSVMLAHLAMQIARNDAKVGELGNALPLLIHVVELESAFSASADPIQGLIKAATSQVSVVLQPQLSRYLNLVLRDKNRKIILMMDGLDELPQEGLSQAVNYIKALLEHIPNLQVAAATSSEYLDGLVQLGFVPLGIATWSYRERCDFLAKWGDLWTGQFMPDVKKNFQGPEVDPLLINNWLIGEFAMENPLELTLKTWSAYAGDLNSSSLGSLLENHINRYMPLKKLLPSLDILAHQFVKHSKYWMDIDEMEEVLSAYQPPEEKAAEAAPSPEGGAKPDEKKAKSKSAKKKKQSDRDAIVTQGERVISALTGSGILSQHPGSRIRFINPIFIGYLASTRVKPEEASELSKKLEWTINIQALRFLAASTPNPPWIFQMLEDLRAPMYPNLMIAARWLAHTPANSEWRVHVMRNLANILQNDTVPLGTRARVAAAFITSRDTSAHRLFKQLLSHQSFYVRQIAVLGCGALTSAQNLSDILEMLIDPEPAVRRASCLALSAIPGDTALSGLVEILMQGDEDLRQAAAESLALNHLEGKQVLEELAAIEDLLTRRAVVFGLVQIREEWSRKLLEKIAVEDGQWVVRNAASHALEEFQRPNPAIPTPLQPPSENAWMLTFASKLGMGIRPGHPATEVLMAALKSGSPEEQILAMMYLRMEPSDGVAAAIYNTLYGDHEKLHEPSLTTLWIMMLSGFKLPNPTQFGLG